MDVDLSNDTHWFQDGGVACRFRSELRGPSMSRPLLENTLRQYVAGIKNVEIRFPVAVHGLKFSEHGLRVNGVVLSDGSQLNSNLVVDATGRQCRTLAYLLQQGWEAPPLTRIRTDTRYVSQVFKRPRSSAVDWKVAGVVGSVESKRQALALSIEDEQLMIVFSGVHGESAPRSIEGLRSYAKTLPDEVISKAMDHLKPVGEPRRFHFVASQRRHFEKCKRLPIGWIPIGDAVCSFNPIYGQGMTSAALQAHALDKLLERSDLGRQRTVRRYMRSVERVVAAPWSVSIGGDLAHAETIYRRPLGTSVLNWYLQQLSRATHENRRVCLAFNRVVSMTRKPVSLLSPFIVVRVLKVTLTRGVLGNLTVTAAEEKPPLLSRDDLAS